MCLDLSQFDSLWFRSICCYLVYCKLVIKLVCVDVDLFQLYSSVLQLIQCDSLLCWFHSIWFEVSCFNLNWLSSTRFDSVLIEVMRWAFIWMLFDAIRFRLILRGSFRFNNCWFYCNLSELIVFLWCNVSWFNCIRPDCIWFDVVWFDVVRFDYIRCALMCLDLMRCHSMWSDLIVVALAPCDSVLVW